MCVICVKKRGVKFPPKDYLKNCFDNNDDGAGFMYVKGGKVCIRKGFETFDKFFGALGRARDEVGDKVPFVMHFRIATQGFDLAMTHPFPISSEMRKLKYKNCTCPIGVAHNGVIHITSDGSKDYSDTMKFITDYLSGIIRNFSWRRDSRIRNTIEALTRGSRLALLDKYGNVDALGDGWVEEDGVLYSNTSYKDRRYMYTGSFKRGGTGSAPYALQSPASVCETGVVDWEQFRMQDGKYDFTSLCCPFVEEDDDSYCMTCRNLKKCAYWKDVYDRYLEGY